MMQNLLPLLFKQENRTPPNQKFSYDLSMQMKQIYPKASSNTPSPLPHETTTHKKSDEDSSHGIPTNNTPN